MQAADPHERDSGASHSQKWLMELNVARACPARLVVRPRTPSSPQRASCWASLQICAAAKSHIQTETPSPSLPRAGIKASAQQDSFNYQVLSLCLGFQFLPAKLVMIFKMPAGKLRLLFLPRLSSPPRSEYPSLWAYLSCSHFVKSLFSWRYLLFYFKGEPHWKEWQ